MSAAVPLALGTHVVVHNSGDHLTGQTGVIVKTPDGAVGDWDYSVLLDKDLEYDRDTAPLGFNAHELRGVA